MLGRLVKGCRCATSLCDLETMFDFLVVTLTFKILTGLYITESEGCRRLILSKYIG